MLILDVEFRNGATGISAKRKHKNWRTFAHIKLLSEVREHEHYRCKAETSDDKSPFVDLAPSAVQACSARVANAGAAVSGLLIS